MVHSAYRKNGESVVDKYSIVKQPDGTWAIRNNYSKDEIGIGRSETSKKLAERTVYKWNYEERKKNEHQD
jgi:hypothetical protein